MRAGRTDRTGRAGSPGAGTTGGAVASGARLDDNLVLDGTTVSCAHCGHAVGSSSDWLGQAVVSVRPITEGGSLVPADPSTYVDAQVVFRQAMCPGCLTVVLTEVVERDAPMLRGKEVGPGTLE